MTIQNQPMRQFQASPEEERKKKEKKDGGPMGMMSGMMGGGGEGGGMSMSDKNSKKEIERLSSTNDALMRALDDAHQKTPEGNLPATEYPTMPSNTRVSHANFADSPADKVAAQNVGMQAAQSKGDNSRNWQPGQPIAQHPSYMQPPPQSAPQGPPEGMQANPQQQNFVRSQNPAFNVGGGMPDMSALDEAYRRQGMGG